MRKYSHKWEELGYSLHQVYRYGLSNLFLPTDNESLTDQLKLLYHSVFLHHKSWAAGMQLPGTPLPQNHA